MAKLQNYCLFNYPVPAEIESIKRECQGEKKKKRPRAGKTHQNTKSHKENGVEEVSDHHLDLIAPTAGTISFSIHISIEPTTGSIVHKTSSKQLATRFLKSISQRRTSRRCQFSSQSHYYFHPTSLCCPKKHERNIAKEQH